MRRLRIAADVGGSFTDLVVDDGTRLEAFKAPATPADPAAGVLTTAGHPDVLLFREGGRPAPFDLAVEYPRPLIPRALTFEIPERILSDGTVRRPLDEAAVVDVIERLRAAAVEAVAACLLWSVVDCRHERWVGELLDARLEARS